MIIKSIMTDEDRKALEYMLSLEYAMPYQLLKTKNNRRKIIYIMTPVLFLLSIGCYFVKSYPMFYVGMGISIIALIWIIWFQSKGKKFENNVHEFVWNKSRYNKVEIEKCSTFCVQPDFLRMGRAALYCAYDCVNCEWFCFCTYD